MLEESNLYLLSAEYFVDGLRLHWRHTSRAIKPPNHHESNIIRSPISQAPILASYLSIVWQTVYRYTDRLCHSKTSWRRPSHALKVSQKNATSPPIYSSSSTTNNRHTRVPLLLRCHQTVLLINTRLQFLRTDPLFNHRRTGNLLSPPPHPSLQTSSTNWARTVGGTMNYRTMLHREKTHFIQETAS